MVSGGERIADRRAANFEVGEEGEEEGESEDDSEEELLGPEGLASDSENEENSEMSESEEGDEIREMQRQLEGESASESENDEDEKQLRWKDGMQEKASQAFYKRQSTSVNLKELGMVNV